MNPTPTMGLPTKVFDRSPLSITRINLNEELIYANQRALDMLGTKSLAGKTIRDIIFDEENYTKVKDQLRRRWEGDSAEYAVDFKRLDDGRRVPVMLVATPEVDLDGKVVGALGIARSVLAENTTAEIHRKIHTVKSTKEILTALASELKRVLPYSRFSVAAFTRELTHVRAVFGIGAGSVLSTPRRWWRITPAMRRWYTSNRQPLKGDLEQFLAQARWRELTDEPEIQEMRQALLRSFLWYPVIVDGRIAASLALFRTAPERFDESDLDLFRNIPVREAVLRALYAQEKEDTAFQLSLMRNVAQASDDLGHVGKTFVNALASHYGWDNAALYLVDEPNGVFRLQASRASGGGADLPVGYTQPLFSGILGLVYEKKKGVLISDVHTDPDFGGHYKPVLPGMCSELCMPIIVDNRVRWILNIEDRRKDAFAPDEQETLALILRQLAGLLERSREYHYQKAIFNSTSDAVLVTDEHGAITRVNHAATRLLGCEDESLHRTQIARYFEQSEASKNLLNAAGSRVEEAIVVDSKKRQHDVLVSVATLPAGVGGRVFVATDLLPHKRAEQLDKMECIYADIAAQIKTPLSLIGCWLQRLARHSTSEAAEALQKIQRQLCQIDLTYSRLFLSVASNESLPYNEILLELTELAQRLKRDLPEDDLKENIDIEVKEPIPLVRGDLFQLSFCTMTIVSYLLRFVSEEQRIKVRFSGRLDRTDPTKDRAFIDVIGIIPPLGDTKREKRFEVAKCLSEMELGEPIIRKFIARHGGSYSRVAGAGDQIDFRIELPTARTS